MDDMQNQMNAILNNPEMMQKIASMAQALNQPKPQAPEQKPDNPGPSLPDIDFSMVQRLSGLVGQSNIDNNQKTLLRALSPYLSKERITKLERAMRAARMANMASSLFGNSGFQFHTGR